LLFAGNFLVTVESLGGQHQASVDEDTSSVRVYTNLHRDAARRPINVSVAGQIRSMRLEGQMVDGDSSDRLNVIEIPLKASPTSIAVNSSMCHLAIGLQTRVLIYGLNGKKADGSHQNFRSL